MEDDDEESYNIPKNEQEVKELEEKITAMIGPYAFGQLKLAYQEQIDITKQKVEEAKKKEIDLKEQISVLEEELSMNIERAAFLEKKIAKDKELMNSVNQKLQQLQAKDKFNFSNEEEDDSF